MISKKVLNYLPWILLIITCVLNINLAMKMKQDQTEIKELNVQLKTKNVLEDIGDVDFINKVQSDNDGDSLKNTTLVNNPDGTIKSILDILSEKNSLVARFSETDCSDCINEMIDSLISISSRIGINNVCILASYENSRNMGIIKSIRGIKFSVYNIKSNGLGLKIENIHKPFLFSTNNSLKIANTFIPIQGMKYRTAAYFKAINNVISVN